MRSKRDADGADSSTHQAASFQQNKPSKQTGKYQTAAGKPASQLDIAQEIDQLREQMLQAAADLEFEMAAKLRDRMTQLEKQQIGLSA